MSHRALFVKPAEVNTGTEVYDVYYSKNGANNLKILPELQAYANNEDVSLPVNQPDIPDSVTAELDELSRSFNNEQQSNLLLEPDPIATEVARPEIGDIIDFVTIEAVYYLPSRGSDQQYHDRAVQVLLPVFVDVGVVLFFSRFVDFEVYNKGDVPPDQERALSQIREGEITPHSKLSGHDYMTGPVSSIPYNLFVDNHLGLLQTLYSLATRESPVEQIATIVTEQHYIIGRIDPTDEVPLPDPNGSGLLIRLPVEDFSRPELARLYYEWRDIANTLRVKHGIQTAADIVERYSSGGEVPEELPGSELEDALLKDLVSEFSPSIADISPTEFLNRVERPSP